MNKELYVSSTPHETRLALVEDGETAEVYIEREKEFSLAGAIFKGRVTRVLPGMQSAFVDIGLERDAFLYVSDFFEDSEEYDRVVSEAENAVDRLESAPAAERTAPPPAAPPTPSEPAEAAPAGEPLFSSIAAEESAAPAAEAGDANRRHRRGRHRRRGGRQGIPEAKFARPEDALQPAGEAAPPPPPSPVAPSVSSAAPEPGEPAPPPPAAAAPSPSRPAYAPMILPGESMAKYRDRPAAPVGAPPPARLAAPVAPAAMIVPAAAEPPAPATRSATPLPAEEVMAETSLASGYPVDLAAERDINPERHVFEHERAQADSPRHLAATPETALPAGKAPAGSESHAPAGAGGLPPLTAHHEETGENFPAGLSALEIDDQDATEASAAFELELASPDFESGPDHSASENEIEPEGDASASQRETEPHARMQARGRSRRRRRHARSQNGLNGEAAAAVPAASAPAIEAEPAIERGQARPAGNGGPRLIGDLLHAGQEILIQVSKEPLGKKGARITSHLALPGRFLVYMPTVRHIGVSRKIASDAERARLKRMILENTKDLSGGFIVRTAGAGASEEEFKADIRLLANLWNDIRAQFEKSRAPSTLHHDLNLVERTLRDQLSNEFTHIWVDTDEQYQRVVKFISYFMPQLADRVRLYTRNVPMFEHYGIQEEIDKALKSKVWLKSGGYIVLNQTEALVAIDVNTGKFVGKSNRLEDTIVKTNVDAIKEIVRQIRLRDLGGIIVIDFIDMDERRNRQRVMQALEEAMRADRAPSKVLSFNDFGLVALTRKRVKQSLERTLGCACPYCSGVGLVKSPITVCNEIYSEVRKLAPSIERDDLVLRVNPEVGRALKAQGAGRLRELEELTGKTVSVRVDAQVHQEQFEIY